MTTARELAAALIAERATGLDYKTATDTLPIAYMDIFARLPKDLSDGEIVALADEVEALIDKATVTVTLPEPEVEPATEPVRLSGDDARELAGSEVGEGSGGWTVAANDHVGNRRGVSCHRLVITDADGRHYVAAYRKGLAENQGVRPWEHHDTVTFYPVVRRVKVVTEWEVPPDA